MNALSEIKPDEIRFGSLELTRIIETAERRKQMINDLPQRTIYDAQCQRKALRYLNEIVMQASGALDHLNGEEGFEGCEDNLHELFGNDPTFFNAARAA